MRATGIVRKVDNLGRVTLPKELRRKLGIDKQDELEIYTEGEAIILLQPKKAACVFCGSGENLIGYVDKDICDKCLANLHGIGIVGETK